MGRSTKSISLVLIGPALLGSSLMISGCSPAQDEEVVEQVAEQEDWVVDEGDELGASWGPPEPGVQTAEHNGTSHYRSHRSNMGGFIGGYLGARAASSVMRGNSGVSPAPSSVPSRAPSSSFGGASARGGFGSSAGHSSSAS